jgi:hypothetical protein
MAEVEQNWELEHTCRDGLGIVLKQLGRFRDSGEQLRYGLALARRTLNPQDQVTSLVNLAVVETALGDFELAAAHLEEAAQIDAQFPKWFHRAYRYCNQAELALNSGSPDEATNLYQHAYVQAVALGEWRMSITCCGGLAMCAKESDCKSGLAKWCTELKSIAAGRERALEDRWTVEAAFAWDACLNQRNGVAALHRLEMALHELSRRDIDHWLRLELEAIRIEEYVNGRTSLSRRSALADLASRYSAAAIASEARKRLPASATGSRAV